MDSQIFTNNETLAVHGPIGVSHLLGPRQVHEDVHIVEILLF